MEGPGEATESSLPEHPFPSCGVVSIAGRRPQMEDTVGVQPHFVAAGACIYHFFGVFDGHGGSQVAELCRDQLAKGLAEEIRKMDPETHMEWRTVLTSCFLNMEEQVMKMCETNQLEKVEEVKMAQEEGSTALVVVLGNEHIVVANCGDSKAVLFRGGRAIPLSKNHKPDVPEEKARIKAGGGNITFLRGEYLVNGMFPKSRAIGVRCLKPYVIAEPEVTLTGRIEEDEFLIVGSDGLWKMVSEDESCDICKECLGYSERNPYEQEVSDGHNPPSVTSMSSEATAAAYLTKAALDRGGSDNISVVVVNLRRNG